jgi:hypothetical protein
MVRFITFSLPPMALALAGCASSATALRDPSKAPPSYAAHATELFDDAIEPSAVGYELDLAPTPTTPGNSNLLRERAQVGDAVVRAHVTTVTAKEEDKGRSWQIGLHTVERLAGSNSFPADFTVEILPTGPSAGILRAFEARLIGKTFVAFVREFARPGETGDAELHFHLAPDAKPDIAAVLAASTIDQVH